MSRACLSSRTSGKRSRCYVRGRHHRISGLVSAQLHDDRGRPLRGTQRAVSTLPTETAMSGPWEVRQRLSGWTGDTNIAGIASSGLRPDRGSAGAPCRVPVIVSSPTQTPGRRGRSPPRHRQWPRQPTLDRCRFLVQNAQRRESIAKQVPDATALMGQQQREEHRQATPARRRGGARDPSHHSLPVGMTRFAGQSDYAA